MRTAQTISAAAIILTVLACNGTQSPELQPEGAMPQPANTRTMDEHVEIISGNGINVTLNGPFTFAIKFDRTFDPASINYIGLWIDTAGLDYWPEECTHSKTPYCRDAIQFDEVERWKVSMEYPGTLFSTTCNKMELGEQRLWNAEDGDIFDKACAAAQDAMISITVDPSSGDSYKVCRISVTVNYNEAQKP